MGILTTQDSARSFSTYVALFGLALLVTSSMYLKELNNWSKHHECATLINKDDHLSGLILCSHYDTCRTAAIVGIIIGVVDVLLVPFLLCCSICLVCGCTAVICVCVDCESLLFNDNKDNSPENQTTTAPATNDRGETTTATIEATDTTTTTVTTTATATKSNKTTSDPLSKFNLKNLPKPVLTILNIVGWVVWVFLPMIGTLLIMIWLCKTDAIRTIHDELYSSALTLFIVALLNFMVFLQKFIDSVCKYACEKICGKVVEKEKQRKKSVSSEA